MGKPGKREYVQVLDHGKDSCHEFTQGRLIGG